MDNVTTTYALSAILALIPAAIWLLILFKKSKRRSIQLLIFGLSIFSVVPVFLLHFVLEKFPQFNILEFLQNRIEDQNINFILLFISVGIVEEIVKQLIVRWADRKYLLVQTINDSIRYSLVAALGFAFAENIFYIFNIWTQLGIQQLLVAYLFRSVFTTTAHLMFSGLFGYYYGIAKFSMSIVNQQKWTSKQRYISGIAKIFGLSKVQAFRQIMILRGLWIAILFHATFNLLLQFNQILPVVIFVVIGFTFLQYKLSQKTGQLMLITDASKDEKSSMVKTDEEVVIELMGMWLNDKKYVDVLHICQRLLIRDPDNKVVQLFKTKAMDKLGMNSSYGKILSKMFPNIEKKQKKTLSQMIIEKTLSALNTDITTPKPKMIIKEPEKTEEENKEQNPEEEKDHYDMNL